MRCSCNYCCSGNAVSVTYSECAFVGLGIQHEMHTSHTVVCGLSGCIIFFSRYLVNDTIFGKKCVLIFSTTFVWNISNYKYNWAGYDHKCILVFMYNSSYSCQMLMVLEFSRYILEKYANITLHESVQWEPSSSVRTHRHDEANSRYSHFFKRSKNGKVFSMYTIKACGWVDV